uniref:ABC transporter domain-containing protein n=1 Tax=Ditylum brightwellii TaxID=49249 RepID=A0A7S1ZRI5_9STRA
MDEAMAKKEEEKDEEKKGIDDNAKQEVDEDEEMDEEAKAKAQKKAEKAARKAEKEAKKARKAEKEAKRAAKIAAEMTGEKNEDDDGDEEEKADEDEVFYGAPDDHAWTDMSAAHKESAKKKDEGPDLSLIYGPDGKKLSNKERKKALKARQAAERAAEYEAKAAKASREGAQFACSQTAVNENDPQWMNSLDINIPSFNISAAGKILFKDSPFIISHGRRYGLVGPNGKGKSTLLKMIASNDLKLPPRVDFLYVEQEVVADNTPAVDAVLKADEKRWNLLEEEKELTKAVDEGDEDPKKMARLQQVYDELRAMGADASEAKARRILYGLGFDPEMQTKPTKMFSGGWRMRISLARALFIEPTLLMLDEPTNHLDLNAVIWLDDYLTKWKKTLLIVSHDQDFLNSITQEILHIEDLKLVSYKGDYDSFKKAEATKVKQQQKAWEKQEKRLRELKRSGQSKKTATENVKKSSKREPGARAAKKKSDAIASGAATAETTELIKRPKEYTVKLEFSEVAELSRPVMEVNRVHFRYSPKHPIIFEKIDFGIDMDSRICVVGPNGAGKSTLLKLLTGEITATTGEVRRNPRLRMGIYNQHFVDRLPMDKTPVEHLRDRFQDETYQSVRNRLGKYGLEGHAHEVTMRDLSGGQKARVVFVELSLQRPHILLLDEPTNNLDIETIDALVDAINEFNGGIVVVTHDQRLIEQCDCTLWVVEKQGVTKWEAGFEDYKDTLLREMEETMRKENEIRQAKLEAAAEERAKKLARMAAKKK